MSDLVNISLIPVEDREELGALEVLEVAVTGGRGGWGGRGRHQQRIYHAVRRVKILYLICHHDHKEYYHEEFSKEYHTTPGPYGDDGRKGEEAPKVWSFLIKKI